MFCCCTEKKKLTPRRDKNGANTVHERESFVHKLSEMRERASSCVALVIKHMSRNKKKYIQILRKTLLLMTTIL